MSEILSSDFLEEEFGPTELEVLYWNEDTLTRVSCTKVIETGQVVEVSLVVFDPRGTATYPEVHQTVLDGASMGKAFRAAGIRRHRETKSAYAYHLPEVFGHWFGSEEVGIVANTMFSVGPEHTPYAELLETFTSSVEDRLQLSVGEPTQELRERIYWLGDLLAGRLD